MIADNEDRDDNKVYFFFTEKALEAENNAHAIYSRVGRLCLVRNVFLPLKPPYVMIYAQAFVNVRVGFYFKIFTTIL